MGYCRCQHGDLCFCSTERRTNTAVRSICHDSKDVAGLQLAECVAQACRKAGNVECSVQAPFLSGRSRCGPVIEKELFRED